MENAFEKECSHFEFDDMETFEHTKLKPLSVTLAVQYQTRRILGFQVSQMPAKGLLAQKAFEKYGYREDKRSEGSGVGPTGAGLKSGSGTRSAMERWSRCGVS
jgi:hypothetical protein